MPASLDLFPYTIFILQAPILIQNLYHACYTYFYRIDAWKVMLMDAALLIICFLYIGILGFIMMSKLDCFIASDGFVKEYPEDCTQPADADAVVYIGSDVHAPAWSYKNGENLNIVFITEVSEILDEKNFGYIFAFSESDLENLMVSSMAKKRDEKVYAGAVCNDPGNKKLFNMLNIAILQPEHFSPEYIVSIIKSDVDRRVNLI